LVGQPDESLFVFLLATAAESDRADWDFDPESEHRASRWQYGA